MKTRDEIKAWFLPLYKLNLDRVTEFFDSILFKKSDNYVRSINGQSGDVILNIGGTYDWHNAGQFSDDMQIAIPANSWVGTIIISVISGTPTYSVTDSGNTIIESTTDSTTISWNNSYQSQDALSINISGGSVQVSYQLISI